MILSLKGTRKSSLFSKSKSTIKFEVFHLTSKVAEVNGGHKKYKCSNFKSDPTFMKKIIALIHKNVNVTGSLFQTKQVPTNVGVPPIFISCKNQKYKCLPWFLGWVWTYYKWPAPQKKGCTYPEYSYIFKFGIFLPGHVDCR